MPNAQITYNLAQWISYRTYLPNSADSRTLISNEKNHEYLLLEGDSSDIWFYLSQGESLKFLIAYASDQGIDEETLICFLAELLEAGLLLAPNNLPDNYDNVVSSTPPPAQNKNTPDAQLEYEISEWAWSKGFLFSAHWEITYRCNEVCIHCFNPGATHAPNETPNRNRDELTTLEAFNLIDDLVKAGVFRLTISGGEATLRKDFFEVVQYARQCGLCVVLYTNGLRLTEAFIEKLKNLWLHSVEISIYSSNPEIHDQITKVPKSFEKSVNALRMLTESNIRAVMKSVQMQQTIQGYQLTHELGVKIGVTVVIDSLLSPALDGSKAPLNHELPFFEMIALAATSGSPLYVGDKRNNWDQKDIEKARHLPVCGAGRKTLSIDPEGKLSTCVAFPMAITLNDFDECGTHERCAWCSGLCPGDALLQGGSPLAAAENHCRQSAARMTAAKMLMSGLNQEDIYAQLGVPSDFGRQYISRIKSVYPHFQLQPTN